MRKPYLKRGYEIYDMYFDGEYITTGKLIDLAELTPYDYRSLRELLLKKDHLAEPRRNIHLNTLMLYQNQSSLCTRMKKLSEVEH